jgi:hypothetical protein
LNLIKKENKPDHGWRDLKEFGVNEKKSKISFNGARVEQRISGELSDEAIKLAAIRANLVADVSKPKKASCDKIFSDSDYTNMLVQAKSVHYSSAPYSAEAVKRRLLFGPVVGTVRLTWEFQSFTGSLFNPGATQTFCRRAKADDANDYCDPARRGQWDAGQQAQQAQPAGADRESWADTWYNHFVTLHGWGVKRGEGGGQDVRYFVVENSWGRIYANDPSAGNNGAGANYRGNHNYGAIPELQRLVGKNHFVLIAEDAAGAGGLEITTREVYSASF